MNVLSQMYYQLLKTSQKDAYLVLHGDDAQVGVGPQDLVDDGLLNDSLALAADTVVHDPAEGRYGYEETSFRTSTGDALIEYIFAEDLAHAWPNPDGAGLFTDTAGPDATRIAWTFAQLHDRR